MSMSERRPGYKTAANDNFPEKQPAQVATVEGRTLTAMELVFSLSRTQEPIRWKEYKVNQMRLKVRDYTDTQIIRYILESTEQEWEEDPVYFFCLVEKLKTPDPIDG